MKPARRNLRPSLRFEVLRRDNFTCRYCGAKAPNVHLQVDHVRPVSKGGTNAFDNLAASCANCNAGKSDKELIRRCEVCDYGVLFWAPLGRDECLPFILANQFTAQLGLSLMEDDHRLTAQLLLACGDQKILAKAFSLVEEELTNRPVSSGGLAFASVAFTCGVLSAGQPATETP